MNGTVRPRVLAIDYGERRVGLALSSPSHGLVGGLPTIDRRDLRGRSLETAIAALVEEHAVERIVLGIPLQMDGAEGETARTVRAFGERLAAKVDVRIDTWDERLTTEAARRRLREAGHSERAMKSRIDQLSAVLMLESYLRRESGGSSW